MRWILWFLVVGLFVPVLVGAQSVGPVVTAFSSLRISSSARGLGMGDVGIASASDNSQLYYNMAKTAFAQNFHQASVSYMPWFSGISSDTRLMNVNYLATVSNGSAMGLAMSYLDLGDMSLRDDNGATIAYSHGAEYHLMGSYALQLGARVSLGVAFRGIGENLYGIEPKALYGVSGDIGYYQFANLGSVGRRVEWGMVVSNLGPLVNGVSLPTNVGIGVGYSEMDGNTSDDYSVGLDVNRLLREDNSGIRVTAGGEYGFASQFFLRGGLSLENVAKGNRKFFSLGVGYKGFIADQSYGLDFYYLVPFGFVGGVSPFQHGFGFTMHLSFGNFQ